MRLSARARFDAISWGGLVFQTFQLEVYAILRIWVTVCLLVGVVDLALAGGDCSFARHIDEVCAYGEDLNGRSSVFGGLDGAHKVGSWGDGLGGAGVVRGGEVRLVGRWAGGPCWAVAVDGDVAYVCDGGRLEVLDCSDPSSPVVLGEVLLPMAAHGVAVSGSYAYVAASIRDLRVIDVSDAGHPHEVGYYNTSDCGEDVAVSGSNVYLVDRCDGLYVFRCWQVCPGRLVTPLSGQGGSVRLFGGVLNPGCGGGVIGVYMPGGGQVDILIYDIRGRFTRRLWQGWQGDGFCGYVWDGRASSGVQVAPGVYVVRLETGDEVLTRKLIVAH